MTKMAALSSLCLFVLGCGSSTTESLTVPKVPSIPSFSGFCRYDWSQASITFFSYQSPVEASAAAAGSLNIWTIRPDGSNAKALTKNTLPFLNSYYPVYTKNNQFIYFTSNMNQSGVFNEPFDSAYNLWRSASSATSVQSLTSNSNSNHSDSFLKVSPDGSKLAFASSLNLAGTPSGSANPARNVWMASLDSEGGLGSLSPLTREVLAGCDSNPSEFSPDGRKILFYSKMALDGDPSSPCLSEFNAWVMNIDGTDKRSLTTQSSLKSIPASFTPDGQKILFFSNMPVMGVPSLSLNLWIMNSDGSNQRPLTTETSLNFDSQAFGTSVKPDDGSQIVFYSKKAIHGSHSGSLQPYNVWVINIDGSGAKPLTLGLSAGESSLSPFYSPDGSKIIYVSSIRPSDVSVWSATQNLWIMDSDGGNAQALTKNFGGSAYNARISTSHSVYLPLVCP